MTIAYCKHAQYQEMCHVCSFENGIEVGYRKAIEDAAKKFEQKEEMIFRGFEVAALLKALLGGGKE